jgi:uncharacterized membrane protein YeiH
LVGRVLTEGVTYFNQADKNDSYFFGWFIVNVFFYKVPTLLNSEELYVTVFAIHAVMCFLLKMVLLKYNLRLFICVVMVDISIYSKRK